MRRITDAVHQDLKELEFDHKPIGPFGIGISLKVKPGDPIPIRHYREKSLETEVVCDHCSLHYAIYGAFAFCPDCGRHNSHQILEKNLDVAGKLLTLAAGQEMEMARSMREDALENVVSAFDAFGREACRVHAKRAAEPPAVESLSFQSLEGARRRLQDKFGFDLAKGLDAEGWEFVCRCFQKRHLMAHKLGIVDGEYLAKANDPSAIPGRRISVSDDEVRMLVEHMRLLGRFLIAQLEPAEGPGARTSNG